MSIATSMVCGRLNSKQATFIIFRITWVSTQVGTHFLSMSFSCAMINNMNTVYDMCVIGGGAAGLCAAIASARHLESKEGARVLVLEASNRVGRSIMQTGNGRCNFSNEGIARNPSACGYHNSAFVDDVLRALAAHSISENAAEDDDSFDPVLDFFEGIGLEWRQEDDGRRYPRANKASVVVDCLRAAAAEAGVVEQCESKVESIEIHDGEDARFTMRLDDNRLVHARAVVVACGGASSSVLAALGLPIETQQPVLGPLRVSTASQAITRQLDNIRMKCSVMLMRVQGDEAHCIGSTSGEVLFRSYGLSGICIFDLSRLAQPGDYVNINVLQAGDRNRTFDYMQRRAAELASNFKTVDYACLLRGLVLPRVADCILEQCGLDEQAPLDNAGVQNVSNALAAWSFEIEGMGPHEQCQVQRGGVSVDCLDPHTMQVRTIPGLFVAGEAVDVDGPCGGYNLHWAWGSGLLAGLSCARMLA